MQQNYFQSRKEVMALPPAPPHRQPQQSYVEQQQINVEVTDPQDYLAPAKSVEEGTVQPSVDTASQYVKETFSEFKIQMDEAGKKKEGNEMDDKNFDVSLKHTCKYKGKCCPLVTMHVCLDA